MTTERGGFGFLARILLASKTRLTLCRPQASLRSACGVEAIVVCAVAHATTMGPIPPVGRRGFGSNPPLSTETGSAALNKVQRLISTTERGGFEPPVPCEHARFPSVDLKPLGHLSNKTKTPTNTVAGRIACLRMRNLLHNTKR